MRNLILILSATFLLIGCKEEAPTDKLDDQIQTEYTLEELENDPDWVEVTDIDTIDNLCINTHLFYDGIVIRNRSDYDSLLLETKTKYGEKENINECIDYFELQKLESNKKNIVFFKADVNIGPKVIRKVFFNKKNNFLVYYCEIIRISGNEGSWLYLDGIVVPTSERVIFVIEKDVF